MNDETRYILFTGATGGLGMPCVKALTERGYIVFAMGTNAKKLSELKRIPGVVTIKADVTDTGSVTEAKQTVLQYTDKLYAIANFAGVTAFGPTTEGDCIATAEKLLNINTLGMVRVIRIFFDLILNGRGRIINCTSEAGWLKAQPFAAAYYLSKHACEAYSDSLRREAMYLGVPVIKIQPGSFRTGLLDKVSSDYTDTLNSTAYYRNMLVRMKSFMTNEIKHGGNPEKLAELLVKIVEAKRPRIRYRIGTGKLLAMMNILPDSWIDRIYRMFF